MNWLDRAISAVSPQAGLRRAEARARLQLVDGFAKRGGYEGARQDHRGATWRNGEPNGPNTSLWGDLLILRRRSRSLVRNNPLAKRALNILVAHSVGCGIRPTWKTDIKSAHDRLRDAWARFVDTADERGQVDFYGLQEQAVRGMFEGGEIIAEKRYAGRAMTIFVMEGEFIDQGREGVFTEGLVTRQGVALEKDRPRIAGYYLFEQNPEDASLWGYWPYSKFKPAAKFQHLYRIRRPGQLRGVPELGASLGVLRDLADYTEAALVKARIEACFGAFVTTEDSTLGTIAQRSETAQLPDGTSYDQTFGEMSPGMIARLRAGEDIKFAQPSANSDFGSFALHAGMQAASGVGVTYDQFTGDLRQANYSSLRAGKVEFKREIEMIQNLTIIPQFCRPIYRAFATYAFDSGLLNDRDLNVPVEWVTPAWEPIDPVKDLQADLLAVRTGRMTWFQFVAAWGNDPQAQLEEIERFNKAVDAAGIVLDVDPRKVAAGGVKQQPDPAEVDAAPDAGQDK